MTNTSRIEEYEEGYKDAEKDILDGDKSIKAFTEEYKLGFRDGYQAASEDAKKAILLKVPKEIRDQIDGDGAQAGWPLSLW